jgi:hypothetical protein
MGVDLSGAAGGMGEANARPAGEAGADVGTGGVGGLRHGGGGGTLGSVRPGRDAMAGSPCSSPCSSPCRQPVGRAWLRARQAAQAIRPTSEAWPVAAAESCTPRADSSARCALSDSLRKRARNAAGPALSGSARSARIASLACALNPATMWSASTPTRSSSDTKVRRTSACGITLPRSGQPVFCCRSWPAPARYNLHNIGTMCDNLPEVRHMFQVCRDTGAITAAVARDRETPLPEGGRTFILSE